MASASNQIKIVINAVANGAAGVNNLSVNMQQLSAAVERAQSQVQKMDYAKTISACGGLSAAVTNLLGNFDSFSTGWKSFEDGMLAVNTMAGKTEKGLADLTDQVTSLGKEVPMARDALAKGLYQTISNGVPEDNWLTFLQKSSRAAVGGMADLEGVVTVTSTVIKNYGLAWDEAGNIQDKIQKTAKNGVTSFEQLQQSLPKVTGNAATLGVTIDELLASFATLTGVSGNTSEVATQMAAVFTALIKPSSQATKIAEEMGITFNASSIQMAGGLQNFLAQLDSAVQEYSAASGMLREEVYGKLFGSAESLRALGALTGQLSDKFKANVREMADATGAIDEAFANRAQTAEAKMQLIKNSWADVTDFIGKSITRLQPYLSFSASFTTTISGLYAVGTAVRGTVDTFKSFKIVRVWLMALGTGAYSGAAGIRALARALNISASAANKARIAVRTLTIGIPGIGIALWAVSEAVSYFTDKTEEATAAMEEQREQMEEQRKAYTNISAEVGRTAAAELKRADELIAIAKDEAKSREERTKAIKDLQAEYPGYFSKIDTERINIDELTRSYDNLKEAILKASRARAAQDKLDENTALLLDLEERAKGAQAKTDAAWQAHVEKSVNLHKAEQAYNNASDTASHPEAATEKQKAGAVLAKARAEEKAAAQAYLSARDELKAVRDEINSVNAANDSLIENIEQAGTYKLKEHTIKTPTTPTADTGKGDTTGKTTAEYHEEVKCIQDIADNISVLEDRRKTASREKVGEINAEIARWQELKKEWEQAGTQTEVWHEQCQTLKEYDENLATISKRMQTATAETMPGLQKQKEELQKGRDALAVLGKTVEDTTPKLNTKARTLKEINENIAYYNHMLESASVDEAAAINRNIKLWQDKADAIKSAGKAAESTSAQLREGYGAVKGIGSGVSELKSAIEGHNSAWQTATGVVDAGLKIYDGVSSVLSLIDKLTKAKEVETAVENASTIAKTQDAAAGMLAGVASGEQAAQALAATGALGAEATANVTDAAAKTMNAHAWMPFVGIGLAAGFVALMVATMKGLPKFAQGGIAYGPTLGLFGEYPGASSNPEVVAPLDKLRTMIGDGGGAREVRVTGELKARGGALVAVIENEMRKQAR